MGRAWLLLVLAGLAAFGGCASLVGDFELTGSSSSSSSSSSGIPCPTKMGTVLAVSKLDFGEGTGEQWKSLGFDIDGATWTAATTNHCQPNSGADPVTVFTSGDNGIDNSYGKNLLPLLAQVDPTMMNDANTGLQNGLFTTMLKMYCLPPTGDVPAMTTKLFDGTALGMMPKWDGTDRWPVSPDLLSDSNDPESSNIVFAQSSVTGSTFDSGKNQTFVLTVPVMAGSQSTQIRLIMHAVRVKAPLSSDRRSATGGVLGGVVNTEEFITEVKKIGYLTSACLLPSFATLLTNIRKASDIMADGTQDSSQTCNGISVGLGFEMKEVQIGVVGPPASMGMACP